MQFASPTLSEGYDTGTSVTGIADIHTRTAYNYAYRPPVPRQIRFLQILRLQQTERTTAGKMITRRS